MKRRHFIAAAPAVLLPASPAPAAALPEDDPWTKAHRLARELSAALAEVRDSKYGSSLCVAVVHPAGRPYAIGFADIDSYDRGWAIARHHVGLQT